MKHNYADILIAIAQGKDIEFKNDCDWNLLDINDTLKYISTGDTKHEFRVAQPKVRVNGVTCNAPSAGAHEICIETYSYGDCYKQTLVSFENTEDRNTVYEALIKPFKE